MPPQAVALGSDVAQRQSDGDRGRGVHGLNEAQNAQHQLFGEAALIAALIRHRELPVKELLQRILDEIARFRGRTPQSDDITLVVIKRLPALTGSE